MRPGVNIAIRESAPPSAFPTDIGVGFMVGVSEKGPLQPVPVFNMTEYETIYGTRQTYAITSYDSAKFYFDEGGYKLYVGRVVGPSAVTATVNVLDGASAITLVASAKGPGEYGNDLNVVVRTTTQDANIPAGYYRVRVQTDAAVILEESPDLFDDSAALLWSQTTSQFITFTDGASTNDPAAATYALATGNLDSANIADAHWLAGHDRFTSDYGPGLIFAPGRTSDVGHDQTCDHAEAFGRAAVLDGADTPTVATLKASAVGRRTRIGALFAPWCRTPGLTSGSTRLLPPSAGVAGLVARNVALGLSPNEPSAGEKGIFRSVLALTQTWSDIDRQTLNSGGVNILRDMFGQRKVYGWRTTADPTTDVSWLNFGNSLLYMAIRAKALAVAERYMFRQIDGERKLINDFGGALIGEALMPFFLEGALFGATPDDAFFVDVGPTVNTEASLATNTLKAVITVRMSPFGEEIDIDIVKLLITEEI